MDAEAFLDSRQRAPLPQFMEWFLGAVKNTFWCRPSLADGEQSSRALHSSPRLGWALRTDLPPAFRQLPLDCPVLANAWYPCGADYVEAHPLTDLERVLGQAV